MIAHVEYTDLFAGEANYCWVKRFDFDAEGMSDLQIVRRAKSELGIAGKISRYGFDDGCGMARYFDSTVMFISFSEE